jgi:nitroimidazol reductase NimA-like FMN-containing flavoprotein (pyridoxamine 5'-phosphate oxidase superfamily)
MTDAPGLAATARQVIDASQYLVLATADQHGVPWASPVWYAHASYREFFWVSHPQARHSRNIETRAQVSIVIFDSSVRPGAAQAVYISAAAELTTGSELRRSIEIYSRRSQEQGLAEWTINDVQAPADHRLYRAVAGEQSVLKPGGVDVRIPINTESIAAR